MSIVKVAALAGVSKSTVSMVINHNPTVVPATAAKVRKAMAKLGYEPKPREQRGGPKPKGMYSGRTLNLALVTLGIPSEVLSAPIYGDVLNGIVGGVREHAHRLATYHLHPPFEFDGEALFRSGADGILLFGRGESSRATQAWREVPCVSLMGAEKVRSWCDWVSYDDVAAGHLAASYLIERGYRTCAFVGDPGWRRGHAFAEHIRMSGGQVACLDSAGMLRIDNGVHQVDQSAADALVRRLAALSPRPTGLFIWADIGTAAMYPSLQHHGLAPGRDIAVVSCNNEWPLLLGLQPRPAVVDLQGARIGRHAVEQLLWRMKNRGEPSVTHLLTPVLVSPEST